MDNFSVPDSAAKAQTVIDTVLRDYFDLATVDPVSLCSESDRIARLLSISLDYIQTIKEVSE